MSIDIATERWARQVALGWHGTDDRLLEVLSIGLPLTWDRIAIQQFVVGTKKCAPVTRSAPFERRSPR